MTEISIVLDTRRIKKKDKYPVKLRVYSSLLQRAKLYSIGKNMTKEEFGNIWKSQKTPKTLQNERDFLDEIKVKAVEAANNTDPFSFELFEKKLQRRKGDGKNVIYHYNQRIKNLKEFGRYGSVESYDSSLKSILNFIKETKGKEPQVIPFNTITPSFLQKYEGYMIDMGKSETTVGIYLRALRAIFNAAIRDNEVSSDLYPFGRNKYEIPQGKAVKKALTKNQLKILLNAQPQTPEQEKAKDFWFFSFICNGMNINDIALLKYGNIKGETIEFKRAKTRQTGKRRMTTIVVHLTELSKSVIEKYGNKDKSPEQYIFSIIDNETTPENVKPRIKNFTRFINQHIKLLAKENELPEEISSYWARHSFATLAIQRGANMEFVMEAFGHHDLKTTQDYFAGFDDGTKKAIVENLLRFD